MEREEEEERRKKKKKEEAAARNFQAQDQNENPDREKMITIMSGFFCFLSFF